MRMIVAISLGLAVAYLLTGGPNVTRYEKPASSTCPAAVTCCCETIYGGTCCAESSMCGPIVPGCLCR